MQEHILKTILFTMVVLADARQPFLIVTTTASLSLWEVQFNKLAPHINVVVHDGRKDMLKLIQAQEFYENGSHITSQVLLSHPDAILEVSAKSPLLFLAQVVLLTHLRPQKLHLHITLLSLLVL